MTKKIKITIGVIVAIAIASLILLTQGVSNLQGMLKFNDLNSYQKRTYWSLMNKCLPMLSNPQLGNYRECALNALNQSSAAEEKSSTCTDSDEIDYLTKGKVISSTYPNGIEDYTYTYPNGKTYVIEGACSNNQYIYYQKDCKELGKDYEAKDGKCIKEENLCPSIVDNGDPDKQYDFIVAFYGLSEKEIQQKGSDLARAQFYRSEYDIGKKTDPQFGFIPNKPNQYLTRAGLFEIEPFKSYVKGFNVYYYTKPLPKNTDPGSSIAKGCTFVNSAKNFQYIILKPESEAYPGFNSWDLENIGTAFNHEVGHSFGLADEYFTEMQKNDLNSTEVKEWNLLHPDCDYNKPTNTSDYATGKGYCTKWCNGVDESAYQKYNDQRTLYDTCEEKLNGSTTEDQWLNFCKNELNFNGYYNFYNFYPGIVIAGNPQTNSTIAEACKQIFSDDKKSSYHYENVQDFCYKGSLYNISDLNIGKSCQIQTGCYAGCGGFSKQSYPSAYKLGAFGDAFRSDYINIMGGGILGNSGPDLIGDLHKSDNQLPSYSPYAIKAITDKFKELGISK